MRTTRETRRARGLTGLCALAALFVYGAPRDAQAFCRSTSCKGTESAPCEVDENDCPKSGAKLFWPTSCVSYATNDQGSLQHPTEDSRAVIRKAFETWSDVPCPDGSVAAMTFQERPPISCKKSQFNKTGPNVNVVLFQDTMWKYRGIDATLAKTSVTYSDETGEIFDADIEVNTAFNDMTITDVAGEVDTDLQAVLTHEVGHFIGLAHSPDFDAVMFGSYTPQSTSQRVLGADDIAAVCATYPASKASFCNTEPKNGFSATCSDPEPASTCAVEPTGTGASSAMLAIGGCIGATALRARRRRRFDRHASPTSGERA